MAPGRDGSDGGTGAARRSAEMAVLAVLFLFVAACGPVGCEAAGAEARPSKAPSKAPSTQPATPGIVSTLGTGAPPSAAPRPVEHAQHAQHGQHALLAAVPSESAATGEADGRVRRTPTSDALILGLPPSGKIPCKYAPVYGYLSADCSSRQFDSIPNLRHGVEALDMSDNKMKAVLNSTFKHLANLRYLYLPENRIKVVEDGALVMLKYLEVLDLSGNRLRSIPHGLLELPRLRKLYFADNLLERMDPSFVFASPTLQLLQLAECSLQDLPLGDMPELLNLNVSRNALTSLPLHDLAKLCRLQVLDVGHMEKTLFEELDMEEACQCQTFTRWVKLRGLDLGRGTRILCKNESNSADNPYAQTCNATQVALAAQDMHGRCVRAQQQELRAQMRGWWVIAMCVACTTVLVIASVLCFCQRRQAEPRHHKVPVVVMTDDGVGNGSAPARTHGRSGVGGGRTTPDGK